MANEAEQRAHLPASGRSAASRVAQLCAALILLLGGCRQVFGLDEPIAERYDGGPRGDSSDALIDASSDGPLDAFVAACPATYAIDGTAGTLYRHVTQAVDWLDAANDCADDLNGPGRFTHLAVLGDDAERIDVRTKLGTTLWIGLSDRKTTNTWRWVTLENTGTYPPTTSPPWIPGGPAGEHCVAIDENGQLETRMCDGTGDVPYLCECDKFENTPGQYE